MTPSRPDPCGRRPRLRLARAVATVAILLGTTSGGAWAQDNPDAQVWVQAIGIGPLSENWRAHVEIQPRLFDDASELGLTIIRTAIGRRIAPRATVFVGYAGIPRTFGPVNRYEQRIWQQLSLTFPAVRRWAPTARVRVEQRWLDPWADASHRVRVLARGQRPFGQGPWSLGVYDEIMMNVDDTDLGPGEGFDRNRVYAGLMRRLSPSLSTEIGYLWEHGAIPGGRRNDHVLMGVLNVTWPAP